MQDSASASWLYEMIGKKVFYMGFFDKLFGGKAEQEETAKFFGQSKTVLTPIRGKVLAQADIPDEWRPGLHKKLRPALPYGMLQEERHLVIDRSPAEPSRVIVKLRFLYLRHMLDA